MSWRSPPSAAASETGLRRTRERLATCDAEMGAEELDMEFVAADITDKTSEALSE